MFGRVLFRVVEQDLGQPIVIDNRGGANGIVGADIVAKSSPDGYTFLDTSFGFAVNPNVVKKLPFDVVKDFLPVTSIALGTGYLLVANNAFPAKTVKELIAPAKTPLALATRFQQAVHKALQVPQVRDHFLNNGYEPQGMPPAQWAQVFRADLKRYAEICRQAKIEPQ